MKNKIALLVTFALILSFVSPLNTLNAFANSKDVHFGHEAVDNLDGDGFDILSVVPGVCVNCDYTGQMIKMCANDYLYEGSRTHRYGFLLQETCTIDSYSCKAAQVCINCRFTLWYEGRHHCLETHQNCGNGHVNVCPFGG